MSKHTPGPWTQDEYGNVITPNGKTLVTEGIALGGRSTPETRANARLIAAAPDLLEALKAISAFMPNTSAKEGGASAHSENVRAADKVRAAIAKAEGEMK